MAISVSLVDSNTITTGDTISTTVSVDPAANELWCAFLTMRTTSITPSISGTGLSWTLHSGGDLTNAQTQFRSFFWRGLSTSNPSAGTITVTITGNTKPAILKIWKATGTLTTGTNGADAIEAIATAAGPPVTDDDDMKVDISTLSANAVVVGMANSRAGVFTVPGDETSLSINTTAGSGGDLMSSHIWYMSVASASTVTLGADNDLNSARDWSIIAVALADASASARTVSVSDSVTVSESVATTLVHTVSASDSSTVTEDWLLSSDNDAYISKSDSATVGESLSVRLSDALAVNITEPTIVVNDDWAASVLAFPSVSDSATTSESINVALTHLVSKSDSATVSESVSVSIPDALMVSKSEAITVTEAVSTERGVVIARDPRIIVTQTTTITATGNQTIPFSGLNQAPKAVRLFMTGGTTNGTAVNHARIGVGCAVYTGKQWCIAVNSENNESESGTHRRMYDSYCIMLLNTESSSAECRAKIVSISATGITIKWESRPQSAYRLTVVAYDCDDAWAGTAAFQTSVGSSRTVAPGFEPNVIYINTHGREISSGGSDGKLSYGIATNVNGVVTQRALGWASDDDASTSSVGMYLSDLYVALEVNDTTGAIVSAAELTNITSTTFDLITRSSGWSSGDECAILAMRFDEADIYLGTIDSRTGTGQHTYSEPTFEPNYVEWAGSLLSAVNTARSNSETNAFAFSVGTSSYQYSHAYADEDGQATTDTQSLTNNKLLDMPQDGSTTGLTASFVGFAASGVTVNWTAVQASARKIIMLAIGTTTASASADQEQLLSSVIHRIRSFSQAKQLTVAVYDPLVKGNTHLYDMSTQINSYSHEIQSIGGYWSASISVSDRQDVLEDWIENGLGRRIVTYNPDMQMIWEGMVNSIKVNLAGLSVTVGPLLNIANKIKLSYSPADTSGAQPQYGTQTKTAWSSNTTSQSKYGIIERVLSGGNITSSQASKLVTQYLADNKEPEISKERSFGDANSASSLELDCVGYVRWFEAYHYNSASTSTQSISAKLSAVLAADINNFLSQTTTYITTNSFSVPRLDNDDRSAMNIIKELIAKGDSSDNRYQFGVYNNRVVHYGPVSTQIDYIQRLADPAQRIMTPSGQTIAPWDVLPGKWAYTTDFLIGRVASNTSLADDPRMLFIESVTFNAPWSVTLHGGKVRRLDQKLAKLGISGLG